MWLFKQDDPESEHTYSVKESTLFKGCWLTSTSITVCARTTCQLNVCGGDVFFSINPSLEPEPSSYVFWDLIKADKFELEFYRVSHAALARCLACMGLKVVAVQFYLPKGWKESNNNSNNIQNEISNSPVLSGQPTHIQLACGTSANSYGCGCEPTTFE